MQPVPVLRHVAHEPLGIIGDSLARRAVPFEYVDLFDGVPERLKLRGAPGLIVMGGPMNVDQVDRYPFLAREVDWIRDALARELPVLGVCLGSQLLAKALGSAVFPNRAREIGWYEIDLTVEGERDPLLAGSGRRQTVFQWHGDTFDLPRGAVHLAESEACRNQAFRFGSTAYGLQFHPEVTAEIIDDWVDGAANRQELERAEEIDLEAIRRQTPEKLPGMLAWGRVVFDRFAALLASG